MSVIAGILSRCCRSYINVIIIIITVKELFLRVVSSYSVRSDISVSEGLNCRTGLLEALSVQAVSRIEIL